MSNHTVNPTGTKRDRPTIDPDLYLSNKRQKVTDDAKAPGDDEKDLDTISKETLQGFLTNGLKKQVEDFYGQKFKYGDYVHMSRTRRHGYFPDFKPFDQFHRHSNLGGTFADDVKEYRLFSQYLSALRAKEQKHSFWFDHIEEYPYFCKELIRAERYDALLACLDDFAKFRKVLKYSLTLFDYLLDDVKGKLVAQCHDMTLRYQTAQTNASLMLTPLALEEEFQKKYGKAYEELKKQWALDLDKE